MPAAVFLGRRRIGEVVLFAQFVGNPCGRRIEIPNLAHDFGAAAAVVSHVAERGDVDAIVLTSALPRAAVPAGTATGWRLRWGPAVPAARGTRKRQRNGRHRD